MTYINRAIEATLREYLTAFPVVGITGPRQAGKSTLLQNVLHNYEYVSFDDFQLRDFFNQDPQGFMSRYNNKVVFDEVQKVPAIFEMVKMAVDKDRNNYGKFILTGSSQFILLKHVSESLAGRIGLLSLLPFQFSEIPTTLNELAIYKGSYPELVVRAYDFTQEWYKAYLETYISKDLRDISNIGNLYDFQRFLHLLAINTSQLLNMSNYAKDLGISVPTIKNWLSILEASYLIFLLPPYHRSFGKRIVKSPKVYFYDTGLVAYLTAVDSKDQFLKGPMCGPIFENYVVAEIKKKITHKNLMAELFYYRSTSGLEVDLIVDYRDKCDLIEIKYTATPNIKMLIPIKQVINNNSKGFLLYNGKEFFYAENLKALNYRDYLK